MMFNAQKPEDGFQYPLARFLPPLDVGIISNLLTRHGSAGDLLLDPFGTSPQLLIEAACAGRVVVTATNNPISRFILQHTVQPFMFRELQTALARLGSARKNGTRLEPYILSLYGSSCEPCGAPVTVDAFIWQRGASTPYAKEYNCRQCGFQGQSETDDMDRASAEEIGRQRFSRELALARIVAPEDPAHPLVAEALEIYPPRALYALITILTKLEQLALEARLDNAARALLLTAMDRANALWSVPASNRPRPLQLTVSPRFREHNVWQALELGLKEWNVPDHGLQVVSLQRDQSFSPGQVCIASGAARSIVPDLKPAEVRGLLTLLPRPNQAFWTLSAIWTAWLFGKEAAAPLHSSLLRRRFDWNWYAGALRAVFTGLETLLVESDINLAIIAEAERSFIGAGFIGLEQAGLRCVETEFLVETDVIVSKWKVRKHHAPLAKVDVRVEIEYVVLDFLRRYGEPATQEVIASAAWFLLAKKGLLNVFQWQQESNLIGAVQKYVQRTLNDHSKIEQLQFAGERERFYWLVEAGNAERPFSDRVENSILQLLVTQADLSWSTMWDILRVEFAGMPLPDRELVDACLRSYAHFNVKKAVWELRAEEDREVRQSECEVIRQSLRALGTRLGYQVEGIEDVQWVGHVEAPIRSFHVDDRANLATIYAQHNAAPIILVLPGSRSALVTQKIRRNPYLSEWMAQGTNVLKFRQIRRMQADDSLTWQEFLPQLELDPPEKEDPQLRLL